MSNNAKADLIYAILAMDSYNRGYGAGVKNLVEEGAFAKVGNFSIVQDISQSGWQAAGFYALAYEQLDANGVPNGQRIISYRGTDANLVNPFGGEGSDLVNGYGLALGLYSQPQPDLALKFYQAVAGFDQGNSPFTANITTTGHSLGGGLAGYIARLYGRSAVLFDNMPFEFGASAAYVTSTVSSSAYNYLYGTYQSQAPTNAGLSAYATTGEFLKIPGTQY